MSNCKQVAYAGKAPFNIHEDTVVLNLLGQLNAPGFGLRIRWQPTGEYVPNATGGQTAVYAFTIGGFEAVPWSWLTLLVAAFENAGATFHQTDAWDLEA